MRSDMPWMERKTNWMRFGPSVLALAIVGVGVGGALQIVRAQDSPLKVAQAVPLKAEQTPAVEQEKKAKAEADSSATDKKLESLLKQRAELDAQIRDLRARSGNRRIYRSLRTSPDVFVVPGSGETRKLTPEERKMVEEAMSQAQKAMEMAQKAMEQAQRVLPKGMPFMVMPKLPNLDVVPGPKAFYFGNGENGLNLNGKIFKFDSKNFNNKDWEKWSEQFQSDWKARQPEFEKKMKEFEKKMELWQRDFEKKMRDSHKSGKTTRDRAEIEVEERESEQEPEEKEIEENETSTKPSSRIELRERSTHPNPPSGKDAI